MALAAQNAAQPEVPFLDLRPANELLRESILAGIAETIDRGDFANGRAVAEFEAAFAEACGVAYCVGLASGLDALRLAAIASDLEPGAGVVVPASTFAASFEAVVQAGGVPVVVDVDETDLNLTADSVAVAAAGGATHVMPVHLYGRMCDMQTLEHVARERDLVVIEDACQAHGAVRDGIRPGQRSRAAAFSFYPTKNLGAMGDAGALVTGDADLAARVRALRVHGERQKYHHEEIGYTARLDTIQAVVLLAKLPQLERWNAARREAAAEYSAALAGIDGLRLPAAAGPEHVWHLYVVRTAARDELAAHLADRGIGTACHYPEPPHLAPAFRSLGYAPGDFPVSEALSREALSLPFFPGITSTQLDAVVQAIRGYFAA